MGAQSDIPGLHPLILPFDLNAFLTTDNTIRALHQKV